MKTGPHAPVLSCRASMEEFLTSFYDVSPEDTDALLDSVRIRLDAEEPVTKSEMETMVKHLGDSRGMARLGLVETFGRIGEDAVDVLIEGLEGCPNPVVRRSCAKALAKIGNSIATDTLISSLLNDDDTVTRSSAAGALAKMGSAAVPKLLAVIADANSSMTAKGHAAWAISFMEGEASEVLFDRALDGNADVRLAVVSALGGIATGNSLPIMSGGSDFVDLSQNSDDDFRNDDEGRASRQQRMRALEFLSHSLGDKSAEVRAEAATALSNAGVQDDAGKIMALLDDPESEVRRSAALALMKLGNIDAIDKLNKCASNSAEIESVKAVARYAATTLGNAARAH